MGYPDWKELLLRLMRELNIEDENGIRKLIEKKEYLVAAEALARPSREKFYHTLGELLTEFQIPNNVRRHGNKKSPVKCSSIHSYLRKLPFSSVMTTNYDCLIEHSFDLNKEQVLTYSNVVELQESLFAQRFHLVKLHGSISSERSLSDLIITHADFRYLIHMNRAYSFYLEQVFSTKSVLFLGFSMSDPDLKWILDRLSVTLGEAVHNHFMLCSPYMHAEEREHLQESLNIITIPYSIPKPRERSEGQMGGREDSDRWHENGVEDFLLELLAEFGPPLTQREPFCPQRKVLQLKNIGRRRQLEAISSWYKTRQVELESGNFSDDMSLLWVQGPSGSGRDALIQDWLLTLLQRDEGGREASDCRGTMWWDFRVNPDFDRFVRTAVHYFDEDSFLAYRRRENEQVEGVLDENRLIQILHEERFVLVLAGLEALLSIVPQRRGRQGFRQFNDPRIDTFLRRLRQVQASRILIICEEELVGDGSMIPPIVALEGIDASQAEKPNRSNFVEHRSLAYQLLEVLTDDQFDKFTSTWETRLNEIGKRKTESPTYGSSQDCPRAEHVRYYVSLLDTLLGPEGELRDSFLIVALTPPRFVEDALKRWIESEEEAPDLLVNQPTQEPDDRSLESSVLRRLQSLRERCLIGWDEERKRIDTVAVHDLLREAARDIKSDEIWNFLSEYYQSGYDTISREITKLEENRKKLGTRGGNAEERETESNHTTDDGQHDEQNESVPRRHKYDDTHYRQRWLETEYTSHRYYERIREQIELKMEAKCEELVTLQIERIKLLIYQGQLDDAIIEFVKPGGTFGLEERLINMFTDTRRAIELLQELKQKIDFRGRVEGLELHDKLREFLILFLAGSAHQYATSPNLSASYHKMASESLVDVIKKRSDRPEVGEMLEEDPIAEAALNRHWKNEVRLADALLTTGRLYHSFQVCRSGLRKDNIFGERFWIWLQLIDMVRGLKPNWIKPLKDRLGTCCAECACTGRLQLPIDRNLCELFRGRNRSSVWRENNLTDVNLAQGMLFIKEWTLAWVLASCVKKQSHSSGNSRVVQKAKAISALAYLGMAEEESDPNQRANLLRNAKSSLLTIREEAHRLNYADLELSCLTALARIEWLRGGDLTLAENYLDKVLSFAYLGRYQIVLVQAQCLMLKIQMYRGGDTIRIRHDARRAFTNATCWSQPDNPFVYWEGLRESGEIIRMLGLRLPRDWADFSPEEAKKEAGERENAKEDREKEKAMESESRFVQSVCPDRGGS